MGVRFTINGADFNREIKKSLSLNSAKKVEDSLKGSGGELIVKKIEKTKKETVIDLIPPKYLVP